MGMVDRHGSGREVWIERNASYVKNLILSPKWIAWKCGGSKEVLRTRHWVLSVPNV